MTRTSVVAARVAGLISYLLLMIGVALSTEAAAQTGPAAAGWTPATAPGGLQPGHLVLAEEASRAGLV